MFLQLSRQQDSTTFGASTLKGFATSLDVSFTERLIDDEGSQGFFSPLTSSEIKAPIIYTVSSVFAKCVNIACWTAQKNWKEQDIHQYCKEPHVGPKGNKSILHLACVHWPKSLSIVLFFFIN